MQYDILPNITSPQDLKGLSREQLEQLANELMVDIELGPSDA